MITALPPMKSTNNNNINNINHNINHRNHSSNTSPNSTNGFNASSPRAVKRRRPSDAATMFSVFLLTCVALLGCVQLLLNALLFGAIKETHDATATTPTTTPNPLHADLHQRLDDLRAQINHVQQMGQIYSDDGNFFPFSIRDSRRLVPTQIPYGMHTFDYVDITTQNQQKTKKATLFQDAHYQDKAPCQEYNLECYKKKIVQVFELVLRKYPNTEYFFYMEADNELCVPLTEVRRLAYEHKRYFITTGIGFSGWIMQRQFMHDFLAALQAFVPPPRNTSDILDVKGSHPNEGPDPIASVMLIEKQAWTVTRQYLVSHSIQSGQGTDALTVKMPNEQPVEVDANGKPKKKKDLDKHLPRCLEPRRSKWRISKKDHRDRFGWDYFDYDECDGEVFPCYVGQLEELLEKDMRLFNYTALDLERQKLVKKQQERERKKLKQQEEKAKSIASITYKNTSTGGAGGATVVTGAGAASGPAVLPHILPQPAEGVTLAERVHERLDHLSEVAKRRYDERMALGTKEIGGDRLVHFNQDVNHTGETISQHQQ